MYKVKVIIKHLIQVELDSVQDLELIEKAFDKLMMWTDPPRLQYDEDMVVGFCVYTTKQNLKHVFDLIGIRTNPYSDSVPVISINYQPNWVNRLMIDKKFIKKKMHRDNYLKPSLVQALTPTTIPDGSSIQVDTKQLTR